MLQLCVVLFMINNVINDDIQCRWAMGVPSSNPNSRIFQTFLCINFRLGVNWPQKALKFIWTLGYGGAQDVAGPLARPF